MSKPHAPTSLDQAIPASDLLLDLYRRALAESQHAFRELIERNADSILVLRPDGEVCYANAAAELLLGVTRQELIGRPFGREVLLGETTALEILREEDGGQEVVVAELRSAEIVWESRPALLASLRDVTARQRTEQALRFLSEASRELAGSLDESTTVASVARLAAGHLGDGCVIELLGADDALRPAAVAHRQADSERRLRKAVRNAPLAGPRSLAALALAAGAPIILPAPEGHAETCWPSWAADGRGRSFLAVPLVAQGRPLGVLTILRGPGRPCPDSADRSLAEDFARRAAAAIQNARLYWEAQEENRRKAEFLAMLGHELRNPLAAIRNALAVQQATTDRGGPPTRLTRPAEVMVRQVAHMSRLVDDLLEVSRVTRGLIRLRQERVDLRTVIADAIEGCRLLLVERNLRFYQHLPEGPLVVTGDPTRLEQVLVNLLHNAAKYTDPGGAITVRAESDAGTIRACVADTGIGISAELLPRLFEPFTTGPQTLERSRGGLGLGLALVKHLVDLHGGTVVAESRGPGQGSLFTVCFPEAPPAHPVSKSLTDEAVPASARRRVLLVEDVADNREMMAALIDHWGHEVTSAGDGETAVRIALTTHPEVVLLDIGLPGLDGYEVAMRIREAEGPAWRPLLVAMTGYGDAADRRRALEAGFDLHMPKPLDLEALERLLATRNDSALPV